MVANAGRSDAHIGSTGMARSSNRSRSCVFGNDIPASSSRALTTQPVVITHAPSHASAVPRMAAVAADGTKTTHRHWAKALVDRVSPNINTIAWPRSDAFVMLGLSALASAGLNTELVMALLAQKSDRLVNNLQRARTSDWVWFEDCLTYDNARLPEALIRAGTVLRDSNKIGLGLESLGWLCRRQTSSEGFFRPVATGDFNRKRESIALFDQQPLEAAATIDACQAAWLIDRQARWIKEAESAYEWYFGANDLGVALVDAGDGECYDGLTNTGLNLNQGAESLVSLQLATCTLQTLPIL